jgi:folate-binding protein YgfZ
VPGAALRVGHRPRGFVGVGGPEATSFLQRMVSNDVEELLPGDSCEALLLTAKGRVIAPMTVWRRDVDDYLLLTEPEVAHRLRDELLRSRFAARVEISVESHVSTLVLGQEAPPGAVANRDYGVAAYELVDDEAPDWAEVAEEELERLRIRAGTPRLGREVDDRVLPAEAGLDERAISFTKGCYPGQEPIARQHYRGRVNRSLRVLELEGEDLPEYDSEVSHEGKVVGRVTSAARDPERGVVALAYVRVEVPEDAGLDLGGRAARPLDLASPRP